MQKPCVFYVRDESVSWNTPSPDRWIFKVKPPFHLGYYETDPDAVDEPPAKLLTSWRDILITLGKRNNAEDRQAVTRLAKNYDGPIRFPGRGCQPLANKSRLLTWWNRLEMEMEDRINQARGAEADGKSNHAYGRSGRAAPAVGGSVKERRKDRKP